MNRFKADQIFGPKNLYLFFLKDPTKRFVPQKVNLEDILIYERG